MTTIAGSYSVIRQKVSARIILLYLPSENIPRRENESYSRRRVEKPRTRSGVSKVTQHVDGINFKHTGSSRSRTHTCVCVYVCVRVCLPVSFHARSSNLTTGSLPRQRLALWTNFAAAVPCRTARMLTSSRSYRYRDRNSRRCNSPPPHLVAQGARFRTSPIDFPNKR